MPSGKRKKGPTRKRAVAAEAAPARRARRRASPKILLAAAGVVVLVAVGITLGVVLTGSSSSADTPPKGALKHATEVQRLLDGIPQTGNVLGSPSAPATMVEYLDVQCPYCRDYATSPLPKLIRSYVRTGKLKLEVRPIAGIGPDSNTGRLALVAAGQQGKFFNLLELLYFHQGAENGGWLNTNLLRSAADSIPGLDSSRMLEELKSNASSAETARYDAQAQQDQVEVTPTILVGKTGGSLRPVALVTSYDEHSVPAAVDAAIGEQ